MPRAATRLTRGPALTLGAALALTPAAAAHFWLDFDSYAGSAAGVPLGGQDGWVTSPAGADWLVHTYTENPYGLPRNPWGFDQFIAAHGAQGPVAAEREASPSDSGITVHVAVAFLGAGPATADAGGFFLEPRELAATFALHVVWSDPADPTRWHTEVTRYDADGAARRTTIPHPGFQNLEPGRWYSWGVTLDFGGNQITDVWIRDVAAFRTIGSIKPLGWYLAGGAAGGLPPPTAVRVETGFSPGEDAVLAFDEILNTSGDSCADCDHSGHVDFFDFLCYQNAFAIGHPWADCDGSGALDFFDFLCFQQMYESGCSP